MHFQVQLPCLPRAEPEPGIRPVPALRVRALSVRTGQQKSEACVLLLSHLRRNVRFPTLLVTDGGSLGNVSFRSLVADIVGRLNCVNVSFVFMQPRHSGHH